MRPAVEWQLAWRGLCWSAPDPHCLARKVIPAWPAWINLAPSPRTGSQHATEARGEPVAGVRITRGLDARHPATSDQWGRQIQ